MEKEWGELADKRIEEQKEMAKKKPVKKLFNETIFLKAIFGFNTIRFRTQQFNWETKQKGSK